MADTWLNVAHWAPFQFDALGLLTLLGVQEVDAALSRLAPSYWLEAFIFTNNLAAWFTRWITAQDFANVRSVVYWELADEPRTQWDRHMASGILKLAVMGPMFLLSVLSGDWIFSSPSVISDIEPRSPWLYRFARWTGWAAFIIHVVTLGMAQLAVQIYVVVTVLVPTVLICYGFGCEDSSIYKGWCRLRHRTTPPYIFWLGSRLRATVFEWPVELEFNRKNDR
ncbi:hypothetical protein BJY00DRAFT_313857 [Aspergillus carlsbadensis]|nr:hypothetical protein BJY00DRAFT_313857 [Aspergillus carlsbadensis]